MKTLLELLKNLFSVLSAGSRFKRSMPMIFDEIDNQLPAMIGYLTGGEVDELIGRSIKKATGKKPTKRQIKRVVRSYDPRIAATKSFRSKP